jgi:hypothetical protein
MSIESDWLGDTASHGRNPGGRPAKDQRGRQRKLHCERCGFIAYASASALERCGFPSCACGEPMVLANLRDRAIVEWDQLERELSKLGERAYNAAMRELGFTDMIVKRSGDRKSGGDQRRCEFGSCTRWARGRYCAEHDAHRPEMGSAYRSAA